MRGTHAGICRITLSLTLLAIMAAASSPAQESPQGISPAARTYLEQALDLMQQNALNKGSIDWKRLREETLARASRAAATADKQDASPSPFAPQKEMQGHIDRRDGKLFAHVVVPMCLGKYSEWEKNAGDFQQFAEQLHGIVMDLQAQKPDGWLMDLRGNGGGNMWPMLAGIGAVLGEGDLGTFVSADGERVPWFYKAGKAGVRPPQGQDEISAFVERPPFVLPEVPWVAVLLDRSTASSGEAVAISFIGRPRERSFGEHTAGFSTSNQRYPLSDGAALFLCVGIEADRTGRRYPDGLDPDVKLPAPDSRPSEEKDAVLQAAENWIAAQKGAPQ
jgi:carboxyl-terminal processing protease